MIEAAGWSYGEEALTGTPGRDLAYADYSAASTASGQPVALLEAKHAGIHPLSGKEQAREYADSIGVSHVLLSNGELHYHWVTDSVDPARILTFPGVRRT